MLASHSNISFLPETGFIRRYLVPGKLQSTFEADGIAGVKTELAEDTRIARLELDPETLCNHQVDSSNSLDVTVYEEILTKTSNNECKIVGDKDPKLVETLDVVLSLWPNSKIIHIFRDPRDVYLSKKKAAWSKNNSRYYNILASAAQFRIGRLFEQDYGAETIRPLCYETLLSQPESTLTELCEWLGIQFEPGMLEFGQAAAQLVSKDEMQWKSETLGPLLKKNSNKWQQELTANETRLVESACREAMSVGGYEPDNRRVGVAGRLIGAGFGFACGFAIRLFVNQQRKRNRSVIKRLG